MGGTWMSPRSPRQSAPAPAAAAEAPLPPTVEPPLIVPGASDTSVQAKTVPLAVPKLQAAGLSPSTGTWMSPRPWTSPRPAAPSASAAPEDGAAQKAPAPELRAKVQTLLQDAYESGTLAKCVAAASASAPEKGQENVQRDIIRKRVKEVLEKSCLDGTLSAELRKGESADQALVDTKFLREEAKKRLLNATEDGRFKKLLFPSSKPADAAVETVPPSMQAEAAIEEAIKADAREKVQKAALDGSLGAALQEVDATVETVPPSIQAEAAIKEAIKAEARETLRNAVVNGDLENALKACSDTVSSAVPDKGQREGERREIDKNTANTADLREMAKNTLIEANADGSLESKLAKGIVKKDEEQLPEGAPEVSNAEEVNGFKEKAKALICDAVKTGRLESIVSKIAEDGGEDEIVASDTDKLRKKAVKSINAAVAVGKLSSMLSGPEMSEAAKGKLNAGTDPGDSKPAAAPPAESKESFFARQRAKNALKAALGFEAAPASATPAVESALPADSEAPATS